jgi:hypothetical protein
MTMAAHVDGGDIDPHHLLVTAPSARLILPGVAFGGLAAVSAGLIHAGAVGIHSDATTLARLFVVLSVLQLGSGLFALLAPRRMAAAALVAVNAAAVGGWLITRLTGVSAIPGLETAEAPQFADTVCAGLGAAAVGGGLAALLIGWQQARPPRMVLPGIAAVALVIPAMMTASNQAHGDHGTGAAAAADGHSDEHGTGHDDHDTASATPVAAGTPTTAHGHSDAPASDHPHTETVAANWPRPWDPSKPIDISGVEGVSAEQEARALALIEGSLTELQKWANPADAVADGYTSIGDAATGAEHYIKSSIVQDDVMLDPSAPESLVYNVEGGARTLAGAMFIASTRPTDDPTLTEWAGPLMQWHNHGDLCWDSGKVVGVVGKDGRCAKGNNGGGEFPMVHVWITPHPCGVFAALEGVGAGQAAVPDEERIDMCNGNHHGGGSSTPPVPYDPTKPIDLGGVPGVTPEQQAAAENIVAENVMRLSQWSDYKTAEAAGFHSIGDGATGHEHFIKWEWINDGITLNPDFPEALVYEQQPNGSKKLVSAMYMLPNDVGLDEVPDIGGALMQWHIHDNLCFTSVDPPRVVGVTDSKGNCAGDLQKFPPSAMIHVWITPHRCGPFAALDGVGAGQILEGEKRLCDEAHGSGGH